MKPHFSEEERVKYGSFRKSKLRQPNCGRHTVFCAVRQLTRECDLPHGTLWLREAAQLTFATFLRR